MSENQPIRPDGSSALTVLLCRGCCCGTATKHPDVDHLAQEQQLAEAAARAGARLAIGGCLDECARSNVIVLRRRERDYVDSIWLGGVLDERRTSELCAYLCDGWREGAPLPAALAALVFHPERDGQQRRQS